MKFLMWIICLAVASGSAVAHADTIITYFMQGTAQGSVSLGGTLVGTADTFGFRDVSGFAGPRLRGGREYRRAKLWRGRVAD